MSTASKTATVSQPSDVSRMERFQALQAGQYWRARCKIPEQGIEAGEVLLIKSIRWVDEKPHTIILRPHPRNIGSAFTVEERGSDGRAWTRCIPYNEHRIPYNEHRFLLQDFLSRFEFEPDHQRVRAEELRQIQNKVTQLQTELLEAQSNPERMALIVEEGLKKQVEKDDSDGLSEGEVASNLPAVRQPAVRQEVVSLATGSVVNAIEAGLTEEGIAHIKAVANREHQIATIKAKWIQAKTDEIAETIRAMTPFYEEQAAAALAATEDVRTYVQKLSKGIESLDLYVGKGVEVQTIRTGASAPREEPLTFIQRKLLMDEEFAVWADVDEYFDFSRESAFFDALAKNDSLVNQIFPIPRAVVVMAVTRRDIDYGDQLVNRVHNAENRKVFLLIRDGENIYRVFSPVESHLGAARLFPSKDEQDRIFRGLDGRQIKFEDVAFTDKLAIHEQHALHYKRFLLLVCGLDHRLKLFGDFYDGPPSMGFMSLEFQERYCRFLHDDPDSRQLLGESRQPLSEWLKEKNSYLRSGSRVLCNWRELMNPDTAPAACKHTRGDRFERRYTPRTPMGVKIAYREGNSLCVDVEVSGDRMRTFGTREFTCKVNLTKFKDGYWTYTDLPYLCLDTVEPEDLHWYIHNRDTRSDHLSYIRFFKQALAYLTAEREAERSTRDRLVQSLEEGKIAFGAQARELVSRAIVAWRAAHRGKPLPNLEKGEHTADWKSLLDQLYVLARTEGDQVAEVEAFVKSRGLEPLRLALNGSAKLMVYAAPSAAERDDRVLPHCWVHCFTLERGKTKLKERAHRWTLLPTQAASETTLHEWPLAAEWATDTSVFVSLERKQALLREPEKFKERLAQYLNITEAQHAEHFKEWLRMRAAYLRTSRLVRNPYIAVPIGVAYYSRRKELCFICVGPQNVHALLYKTAPSPQVQQELRSRFINAYSNRSTGARWFDEDLERAGDWALYEIPIRAEVGETCYVPAQFECTQLSGRPACDPRLGPWLTRWQKQVSEYAKVWFTPELFDETGLCVLDKLLGIELPKDFEPLNVVEIELHSGSEIDGKPVKYGHWIDIFARSEDEESDGYIDRHKERRVQCAVPKDWDYSSHDKTAISRARARALVEITAQKKGCRAVRDVDLPDAAPAPEGVERWYLIGDEASE